VGWLSRQPAESWWSVPSALTAQVVHQVPIQCFLGYHLIDLMSGFRGPSNLALASMDWEGDLKYKAKLLNCLREPDIFNKTITEYTPRDSNITLNIWPDARNSDHTAVKFFNKFFRQNGKILETEVLYYNYDEGIYIKLVIQDYEMP
jgi:hypothetical protein